MTERHEADLANAYCAAEGRPPQRARTPPFRTALKIAVPIVLVAALLYGVDWAEAADQIAQIPLWPLLALFVAMVAELVVSTVKWSYALRMHDLLYPFRYLLRALCSGFFLNSFLPTAVGGDIYRVYRTLPPTGFRSRALSAVLIERAVGLLTLLALGGVGALFIADQFQVARVYSLVLLAVTAVGAIGILALERGWLHGLTERWDRVAAFAAVHHSIGLLGDRGRDWLALLALSAVYQAMSIGILFCLFALLSTEATLAESALIAALIGVAAVLPITINGIGVMESALVGGAVMLGIGYDQAVVVAFLRRFLNLSLAASCGVFHVTTLGQDHRDTGQKPLQNPLAVLWQRVLDLRRTAAAPAGNNGTPGRLSAGADVAADVPLTSSIHAELLENTHDAIIIWEMDGGGIQYFNRAAEQLYGYSRDEARGRTTHELLKTEIGGGIDQLEKSIARFGVWLGELRHTTRDGRHIEVEGRLALISQSSGRWLVLEVNRDISDRKAAETAREEMARQVTGLRSRTQAGDIGSF